jgi:hypothetical protein
MPASLVGCSLTKSWTHVWHGDSLRGEFDISHLYNLEAGGRQEMLSLDGGPYGKHQVLLCQLQNKL